MAKKRVVIDYDKLPEDTINRIKMEYPDGYEDNLITFTNAEGRYISALPFETEEIYYLIRMTANEARQIVKDDEDFDSDGKLRGDFAEDIETDDAGDDESEEYLDDNYDEAESVQDEPYEE
ncbi:MAG: hypothetical protein A2X13_06770 [Bacteroidetes bacterium GWC2_33_15]|nr:MAG: hypothetical protein A2X10_02200 [Bacteroidetes bacterium GWA2_33_15]OFX52486.1 MAG: hypothetical protein A2X13_06770 [Bacteroidetes bacterium GWC2_33_15]OFX65547.1 MAG: hypothetical protein A2X15_14885 [Bacteroidetes bacterium GWB2_32_14]OFX67568.1 MAG: hypothetical protein A2X14_11605 [Bacteroidetes bacterium GWD2_33_33]HAN18389.1 hypothetical protein [Bacteroidales bacterium]